MAKHPPCTASSDVGVIENEKLGLKVNDFTRSHPFTPELTYVPKTKRELVSAILDGEARGGRMKARGGCYSLSAAQNPDDFLIDTRLLDKYLSRPFPFESSNGDPIRLQESRMRGNENLAAIIRRDFPLEDLRHLVHVEAGIGIKALLKDLSIAGLGLPTMGSGGMGFPRKSGHPVYAALVFSRFSWFS